MHQCKCCQGLMYNTDYLGQKMYMDALHVGLKTRSCLACKCSSVSLCLCKRKHFLTHGEDQVQFTVQREVKNNTSPFVTHFICLTFLPAHPGVHINISHRGLDGESMLLIHFQYTLHSGCSARGEAYHSDIIHMQPGLGNPSNRETKPLKEP